MQPPSHEHGTPRAIPITMPATRVFLSIRRPTTRRPSLSELAACNGAPYVAEWIARGTSSVLYASKKCFTEAEAVKLARVYLAKRNAPVGPNFRAVYGCDPTTYVDTTPDTLSRFGYSVESAS